MKAGAENRKKTIALGVLGAAALCGVLYNVFSLFDSGPGTPPPAIAPVSTATRPGSAAPASTTPGAARNAAPGGAGAIPGVAAQKLAISNNSIDPTLDQAAMLRTEGLVYTGSGRNIFSANSVAVAAPVIPRDVPPARPVVRQVPTPQYLGPPAPPPIPLRFFGTAERRGGQRQALLLSGDEVYVASPGEIVAKRYKVGTISSFGVQVTDLGSNNTQTLPLQQQ